MLVGTNLEHSGETHARFARKAFERTSGAISLRSPRVLTLCPHSLTIRTPALQQFVLVLEWGVAKW
jgi:hypothetical protein